MTFYTLPLNKKISLLQEMGQQALSSWGIQPTNAHLSLIKYRENAVFAVEVDDLKYALRIHRPGYHSEAALRSELLWVDALREAGVPVPSVIPAADGDFLQMVESAGVPEPRPVDLFEWIDGENMDVVVDRLSANGELDQIKALYHQVGALAGILHNQAVSWSVPTRFERHAWDADGLTGDDPFWGRFWELEILTLEERALILKARDKVRAGLLVYGKPSERYSMIHADFDQANLMVAGNQVRVIDFDDAGFGWHLFEIATALYFLRGESFYPVAEAALIAGYRTVRDLPDEEVAQLPLFMTARSFTYLGWVHTRPETKTAIELGPDLVRRCLDCVTDFLGETINDN